MKKQKWYTLLFDELNKYWEEIADARATEKEAEFIQNMVKPEGLVLDLCCGTGRHSILLSKEGWDVVGFDLSPNLLKIAKERMAEAGVRFPLVRGEMRRLPFRAEVFDATINMFTSFGYLPSDDEDLTSLKEVARALKKEGVFLIDVVNREHLLQAFKKKDWGEFPSFYMLEKRTLDTEGSKLYSKWTIIDKDNGESLIFDHNLRLYSLSELGKLLDDAGLMTGKVFGDYDGQEFGQDSPRLIILARK